MSRLSRFFQLENGWLVPMLLLALVMLPVFSLNDASWVDRTAEFFPVVLIAAIIGVALAKSRLHRLLAVPLGIALLLLTLYTWLGQLLPSIGVIQYRLWVFPSWLVDYLRGQPVGVSSLQELASEIIQRNSYMAARLWGWVVVGTEGGYSSDNFIFFFLLAILTGVIAFYTAWCLYRYQNATVAVLPVGIFLVVNSFLSNRGFQYIILFVLITLILLMASNLTALQRVWQKKDIDYSAELHYDLTIFALEVSVVLATVAFVMPTLRANPVASTWWIYASQPWGNVETLVNRLFSGVNNPNPDLGTGSKGALVLGGSFEPSTGSPVYMYIGTNEYILSPEEQERYNEPGLGPPQHYWRGETWDFYTGRGWDHSEKVAVDRSSDQPIIDVTIPGAITVVQSIEIVEPRADILYATNQPVETSQPYRIMGLGPDDYSTLYLRRAPLAAARYQVTSTIPYVGVLDLQRASTSYPDWVKQYYLQLPSTLPARVTQLAKELTANAPTPYDKAIAIQEYLRKLPYDATVKLPSSGDYDAVDYFLFTQKGYCDYFGTVMAVMLRTVGVPARLATGYLPGFYDYDNSRYEVSEKDGHAWTEVYMPPYGWIDFEPTPSEAAIVRPEGSVLTFEPPNITFISSASVKKSWLPDIHLPFDLSFLRAAPIVIAVLLALGLAWALWPLMERRLVTSNFVMTIYGRMCRYAAWAGLIKPLAATPSEYARSLGQAIAQPPLKKGDDQQPLPFAVSTADHVKRISDAYVEVRYSQHLPTDELRERVMHSWQVVKGRLWRKIAAASVNRVLRRS